MIKVQKLQSCVKGTKPNSGYKADEHGNECRQNAYLNQPDPQQLRVESSNLPCSLVELVHLIWA